MRNLAILKEHPTGLSAFLIIWGGQLVSLLGTAMSQFALTIWAWQATGRATSLALVTFFSFGPTVLLSPLAGALADRWDRKLLMMLSDAAAGLSTLVVFVLLASDRLEIWHLYVTGAFTAAFQAFQFPAYMAAVTMLVPKEHYTRASGMLSFAQSVSGTAAPFLAGILLGPLGLKGVLLIDGVTFLVAVSTLALISIPKPARTASGLEGEGNLWRESFYGLRYIVERPSFLYLQSIFFFINLIGAFSMTLIAPMVLARTGNNEVALGSVNSAFGIGGIASGLLLGIWGGPKNRIYGVLLGWAFSGLVGNVLFGLGQGLEIWVVAAFFSTFFFYINDGSLQSIWQSKVAPDVQGRVFAGRRLMAQTTVPLGMLLAGPLADFVFEPAMMPEGRLAVVFGELVGVGPGAGMALIFVLVGLLEVVACFVGFMLPSVRNIETLLPDYDCADGTLAG